jgi:hypothetical protein
MCCFFAALALFGPRLGVLIWWLVDPARFELAFDSFLISLLGFIFLPWTTIFYLLVFPGGIIGFDWIWLGIGVLFDLSSYASSAARRRDVRYYPESAP